MILLIKEHSSRPETSSDWICLNANNFVRKWAYNFVPQLKRFLTLNIWLLKIQPLSIANRFENIEYRFNAKLRNIVFQIRSLFIYHDVISLPISLKVRYLFQPFRPTFSDLDYADVDYRSYGPINYKAASITAAQRRNLPDDDDEELLWSDSHLSSLRSHHTSSPF